MKDKQTMKNDTSTFGDWAFLIGGIGLIGGWVAYENADQVHEWLLAMQTPAPTTAPPRIRPANMADRQLGHCSVDRCNHFCCDQHARQWCRHSPS